MHDLNTINRLNAEAFADSVHHLRAAGHHVLARYEGLHLVSIETFSDGKAALHAREVAAATSIAGERTVLYAPTGTGEPSEDRKAPYDRGTARAAMLRDQSEDRAQLRTLEQLADLGRSTVAPDTALGDYITRKTVGPAGC